MSQKFFSYGKKFSQQKKFSEAIKYFLKAISIDPSKDTYFNSLGNAYLEVGKYVDAIKSYQTCLKLNNKNSDAYYNMGNAFFELKNYSNSIKFYLLSLKINDKNDDAYVNLGISYMKVQKFSYAIKSFQKALKYKVRKDIFFYMGLVYKIQKKFSNAIECYKNAIKLDKMYASAYKHLGLCYKAQKDYIKATKCFEMAIEIDENNNSSTYNILGKVLKKQKKHKDAIKCYVQAINSDSNNEAAYKNMGEVINSKYQSEKIVNGKEVKIPTPRSVFTTNCFLGNLEKVKKLMKSKDFSLSDNDHRFGLHIAAFFKRSNIVEYLYNSGSFPIDLKLNKIPVLGYTDCKNIAQIINGKGRKNAKNIIKQAAGNYERNVHIFSKCFNDDGSPKRNLEYLEMISKEILWFLDNFIFLLLGKNNTKYIIGYDVFAQFSPLISIKKIGSIVTSDLFPNADVERQNVVLRLVARHIEAQIILYKNSNDDSKFYMDVKSELLKGIKRLKKEQTKNSLMSKKKLSGIERKVERIKLIKRHYVKIIEKGLKRLKSKKTLGVGKYLEGFGNIVPNLLEQNFGSVICDLASMIMSSTKDVKKFIPKEGWFDCLVKLRVAYYVIAPVRDKDIDELIISFQTSIVHWKRHSLTNWWRSNRKLSLSLRFGLSMIMKEMEEALDEEKKEVFIESRKVIEEKYQINVLGKRRKIDYFRNFLRETKRLIHM